MAATTEGYIDARANQAKAEVEITVAQALLSIERSINRIALWAASFVLAACTATIAIVMALT